MPMTTMDPDDPSFPLADCFVEDHCQMRIRSEPDRIAPTVDYLIQRAQQVGVVHPGRAARIQMAIHEALTNSIIHGNLGISSALKEQGDGDFFLAVAARMADPLYASRIVDVQATYSEGVATWVFADQGAGFDVEAAMRRLDSDEPDLERPSGRGLLMIRAFTDEMCYEDRGRRLTLRLGKKQGEEKRVHLRLPLGGSVHVTPIGPGGEIDPSASREAVARDLSAEGIGFLQSDFTPSGRLMITIQTGGEPICVPAEVRHWQTLGDQIIEVGCRFETPLSRTAVEGAHPSEAVAAVCRLVEQMSDQLRPLLERRTAPRVPYSERISIEVNGSVVSGIARDLSRNGVAFFSTTNLPLEVVHLTLPGGGAESSIHLPARIVRCTRIVDGFYDIAAQFAP